MSSRTNLRPQLVISSQSMAANITSSPTILQSITKLSYQAVWTGTTPVGTLSVQVSDNYSLNQDGTQNYAGDWNTLTLNLNGALVTSIPVSGNSGTIFIDVYVTAAYAGRLVYTRASGTGTMSATVNGKVS